MSGKSVNGFNRSGGGAADGTGGFAQPGGSKLADGTDVLETFAEVGRTLEGFGYHKAWVDGWQRNRDGAVVTVGYSYREVRVRRFIPGHTQGSPQAILNIRGHSDLQRIDEFVDPPVGTWGEWDAEAAELVAY